MSCDMWKGYLSQMQTAKAGEHLHNLRRAPWGAAQLTNQTAFWSLFLWHSSHKVNVEVMEN